LESVRAERIYLSYLEQWLEENQGAASSEEAALLRDEVRELWGESVERRPNAAGASGAAVIALTERFTMIAGTDEAARILLNTAAMAVATTSPIMEQILHKLVAELQMNPDFRGEAKNSLKPFCYKLCVTPNRGTS
jgi:hypothetical protein